MQMYSKKANINGSHVQMIFSFRKENIMNQMTKTTGNAKRILHFAHSHRLVSFAFWSGDFFFSSLFVIWLHCKLQVLCMLTFFTRAQIWMYTFQPLHFSLAATSQRQTSCLFFCLRYIAHFEHISLFIITLYYFHFHI